jgi:Ca2+ transporting ATPase
MSVCKMFTFKNEKELDEFELSGSTYEPIGELFHSGSKAKGSDYPALEEISTISVMCNDSAIDFNEFKNAFEKVSTLAILNFSEMFLNKFNFSFNVSFNGQIFSVK